jgi:ABC-2 type transport system ATP-binding protein
MVRSSSPQPVIELTSLTKRYPAAKVDAVHDVSLKVMPGQVFGFLGPNGAGKSTTINLLIGLIRPTSGSIQMLGLDAAKEGLKIRREVGYLTGDIALDGALTGAQQLEYVARLRGKISHPYVKELAKRLDCDLKSKIKTLSRGNRQKIGLIAALMHRPQLLILDEPTSGLDPLIQIEFNKIILEHKSTGGATFISSHVLSEVQELCDQVAIVRRGKLVANKPLRDIVSAAPKHVRFTVTAGNAGEHIKGMPGVSNLQIDGKHASLRFKGNIGTLTKSLAKKPLANLTITDTDLEEIFRKYYEDDHA